MNFKVKEEGLRASSLVEMEQGETLLVVSKKSKSFFLQVTVDEYDDICFVKRENLANIISKEVA